MKLVETFPFSEVYELELLLLKFKLSNGYIDAWIICENSYTFQGDHKGLVGQNAIKNDTRFLPFLHKIIFVEEDRLFHVIDKNKFQDSLAFECEIWQRQLAVKIFLKLFTENDWLVIHDIDEMFDFTDLERLNEFFEKLNKTNSGIFMVPRLRYWFDYDNLYPHRYSTVIVTGNYLLQNSSLTLHKLRHSYTPGYYSKKFKNIIVFEYSSCYSKEHIIRKLKTNSHTGISEEDLNRALLCNHRAKRKPYAKYLSPTSFMKFVILDEKNSPELIRENLVRLKTNVVDINYEMNRRKYYPEFYTIGYIFADCSAKLRLKLKRTAKRIKSYSNTLISPIAKMLSK